MLTKNFYSCMRIALSNQSSEGTDENGIKYSPVETWTISGDASNRVALQGLATYRGTNLYGVQFGSGNTPPTVNDYKLDAPITENLAVIAPSAIAYSRNNNYEEYSATFYVNNTDGEDITVAEIGLFGQFVGKRSTSTSQAYLSDRTVLDEPIIIPAGQGKSITYTIRFNYPV